MNNKQNKLEAELKYHTIVEWFQGQVRETPENVAVALQEEKLTYSELNTRSNYVAKRLLTSGINKGDIIAIMTGRSVELIVGILGVLKAGAAFLPIDITNPEERIRYMLEDSGTKGIIAGTNTISNIMNVTGVPVYIFEKDGHDIEDIQGEWNSTDLAYIIYTSGTTGVPKGVMLENEGLVNFINWSYKEGCFDTESVVLQKATCSFDASLYEIFLALFSGSTLQMLSEEENEDFRSIINTIREKKVTHLVMIPTILSALLDYMQESRMQNSLDHIKRLYIAGEALTIELLRKYTSVTGQNWGNISNLYGPTEASICATGFNLSDLGDAEVIPIGKPIDNVTVYIIKEQHLCGIGEEGELCIGGIGVGRGYLNRSSLTKEKFITDPYREGCQMYRSGDLVKWDESDNIIFLGRIDEQIKLNGLRIELGEIRSRLLSLQGIDDAAVTVAEINAGKHLAAYLVSDQTISQRAIKAELRKTLPEYMVPDYLMKIDKLPITANGKLDYKALPEIEIVRETRYIAPQTQAEQDLVVVMADVLTAGQIGTEDDFFELGGDSIKAIRIVSKLREQGYNTNLQMVMKERTIKRIARGLTQNAEIVSNEEAIAGEVLLTPIQDYFFKSNLMEPHHFNQSFLLVGEKIEEDSLKAAIDALKRHHDMLRTVYFGEKQIIRPETENTYEFYSRKLVDGLNEEEILEQIEQHEGMIQKSMNLEQTLVKFCLFSSGCRSYLLFAVHHLIVDGISWRILIEDLNTAYTQRKNGEKIKLPKKTTSLYSWSKMLQEYGECEVLRKEKPYWEKIERTVRDRVSPFSKERRGGNKKREETCFTEAFTQKLLLKSSQAYCTEINDLLVTALFRALVNITGKTTVTFNLEGHGREEIHVPVAIDRTVGWFTTVYPVIGENMGRTLDEDIQYVKEMLRRIPNKGLGYGVLKARGELGDYYDGDITFNYLGDFSKETDNYEMNIHTIEYGDQVSSKNHFASPISIDCSIIGSVLHAVISYEEKYCSENVVNILKEKFSDSLLEVVDHCVNREEITNTASDFGELVWSEEEFRDVEKRFQDMKLEKERIIPLSPMQEGMLFEKLAGSRKMSYIVQSMFRSDQQISESLFRKSIVVLQQKHQVLRSRIIYQGVKEPRQVIVKQQEPEFYYYDLRLVKNREKRLGDICREDINKGFDFEKTPLFRASLIHYSEADTRVIFSFHHIIMDGWCMPIILSDLGRIYQMLSDGFLVEDILAEEETEMGGEQSTKYVENKKGQKFWQDALEGYGNKAKIRPEGIIDTVTTEQAIVEYNEDKGTSEIITKFCKESGITPNSLFEMAWGVLLQRITGLYDVVFGRVVSGRNQNINNIENRVGLFINTIPVRIQTDGDDVITELLKRVYNQSISSMKYESYPLPAIQKLSNLEGDLIQSLVAFEILADEKEVSGCLQMERLYTHEQTNYPITLNITKSDVYRFQIMYDATLYGRKECQQILDRFHYILTCMMATPELKLKELDFILPEEREKVIVEFNNTKTNYPADKTVPELFADSVKMYPERIAVRHNSNKLTYQELDDRSEQVAAELVFRGVGKGDIVGIVANREIDTVVGFLGILKSGAVYLPLDINNPDERQEYILNDCNCRYVLDYHNNLSLENYKGMILGKKDICSDKSIVFFSNMPTDLAYVIYTSGTTGEPKGVMIEHRSIIRLVKETNYYSFDDVRILQTGSLTFDACTFEIWGALLNGGMVSIAQPEVLADSKLLAEKIKAEHINSMFMTTALFHQLAIIDAEAFKNLKYLVVGGEKMAKGPAMLFKEKNPHVELVNGYGPTECTTFAITEKVGRNYSQAIPIGRPIANTTAYVLGNDNRLCGIGMPGELCLGGAGLAQGYLGNDKLTAEKFIENPYVKGETIYRTGDLVRWLNSGVIDYMGRIDDQVKIRGFRIELGEIAAVLKDMNEVSDAIVVARKSETDHILCAYLQLSTDLEIQEIKKRLAKKIPSYMIPVHMMKLSQFPLTSNGKVDKKQLPIPDYTESDYIEPENLTQKQLQTMFEELLQVKKISINDDFFTMGGHSLKLIRLVSMIEKEFGKRLRVSELMQSGTIRAIERMLMLHKDDTVFKAIEKTDDNEMSSVQKRIFTLEHLSQGTTAYNIPILLKVSGEIDTVRLQEAIQSLCKRHEILRTCFRQEENEFKQIIYENVKVPFETKVVEALDIKRVIPDIIRSFSLNEPPLIRSYLLQNKYDKSSWLLFDVHHIILDGASISQFISELCKLYCGEEIEAVRLQYKDYSAWHNRLDQSLQEQYWLNRLKGEEFTTHLREDYVRNNEQTFLGDCVTIPVEQKLYQQIKKIRKDKSITDYMIFMSAVSLMLSRYCGQEKIFIGTAVSGRTHVDVQDMLGMFVNTIVIANQVVETDSFERFLQQTKEVCTEAFDNQDYPFERLVEKLGVSRSSSRNPLFDVLFILENEDGQQYTLGNSYLTVQEIPNHTAKFDLVINVKVSGDSCKICWEYNKALFKRGSIERMAGHLMAILDQAVFKPEQSLCHIQNVAQPERDMILKTFGIGKRSKEYGKTIVQLFEEQVYQHPDRIAAQIGADQITYSALNAKANSLAVQLQKCGVGHNKTVALITDRSLEMLIGIMGTLKAGASYVPISAEYPLQRKQFIIKDCNAEVLLTHGRESGIEISTERTIIDLNHIGKAEDNITLVSRPEDPAYIIYTSGTTGKPKGVIIKHRNLVNLMVWQIQEAQMESDSVVLQKSTNTFDASVWEIFLALLSGAKLQMLTEEENEDYYKILEIMKCRRVTHTLMIPTVFDTLLDYVQTCPGALDSLKHLYLGAEVLQHELLEKYVKVTGKGLDHVRNLYGPTEGTVCATCYNLSEYDPNSKIPIGKPIDNVEIYILQGELLCGIGMVGELCIGGAGVSAGYMNQKELTKSRFVKQPEANHRGIYRTGDLACWREDGTLEYVGRVDEQVKIRGFRVELNEISTQCLKINGVNNAATIIYEKDNNQYICCYLVKAKELAISEIRSQLKAVLPDYMVPSYFCQVEKLPVTPNGKLDRKALPEPDLTNTREYTAPRNKKEQELAELFSEILGIESVGIYDSFLALGGHSIKAANLVRLIEKKMGSRLSIKDIMQKQDVCSIAEMISKKGKSTLYKPLIKAESL